MSCKNYCIGDNAPKIQRSSCTPRRHCERWFWILCSIYWTRFKEHQMNGVLHPILKKTQPVMMRKRKMTSGRAQETSLKRVKLYMPKEETFLILTKYIDVTRTSHTSLDVMMEKHIEDDWNVDGKRIIWCVDTLHKIHLIERKATWRIYMVRGDAQENKLPLVLTMYGQIRGRICLMQRKRKKNKDGLSRHQNSTMPDNWEEYSLSNQTMNISSTSSKAARRKLEVPMPAAILCKIPIKEQCETFRNIGKRRTRFACIVDADESRRPRVQGAVHISPQDHITAKGMNSMTHHRLVHNFIPTPLKH